VAHPVRAKPTLVVFYMPHQPQMLLLLLQHLTILRHYTSSYTQTWLKQPAVAAASYFPP
jgi:hypothetical protein